MRDCPLCGIPLQRVRYEGFPIHRCPGCNGVLIENARIGQITRKMDATVEEIMAEANAGRGGDTLREIRCPRCRFAMRKDRAFANDAATKKAGLDAFGVDVCDQCGVTWLDGGELAKIQLNYELSPAGLESRRHYVNYDKLDPAQKEEFIRALAGSVPDVASSYAEAFADAVARAAHVAGRRALGYPGLE